MTFGRFHAFTTKQGVSYQVSITENGPLSKNIYLRKIWSLQTKNCSYTIHIEKDLDDPLQFCFWFRSLMEAKQYIRHILFTDEASFSSNQTISLQYSGCWAEENSHFVVERKRHYSFRRNIFSRNIRWPNMWTMWIVTFSAVFVEKRISSFSIYHIYIHISMEFKRIWEAYVQRCSEEG